MKKRAAALVCAVLLAVQILSPPVSAADTVYFTAVNETVLELSDATMPFWHGGRLYVSASMFSTKELGIYYSWNSIKQTVVLSASARALIFSLSDGTVTDGDGENYWPPAITKGSGIFLPVDMVARFFGLTYSNTKVTNGYLIRIRSSDSVLSDSVFADAAAFQLASRYSQYQKLKEPVSVPEDTPTETTVASGQLVALCFQVTNSEKAETLLNLLYASGAYATFYFSREQILKSGDLLRRMTATGYAVGLIADASVQTPVDKQLQSANEALCSCTGGKTRLCKIENSTKTAAAAAREAGYCCLRASFDRSAYGLNSSSNASYLIDRIRTRSGAVSVWLSGNVSSTGLRAFLAAAKSADDRLMGLTEIS